MKYILTFILSVMGTYTYAQSVLGVVRDADNNPLPGSSVWWVDTTVGSSTDLNGEFKIHEVKGYNRLVASFLGYENDTLTISGVAPIEFKLSPSGVDIDGVVVNSTIGGNYIKHDGLAKSEMISFAGLCKMACCNLAESFENSASVTVGYSDAISGARQIKMLGLAGIYTQILDENRPIMRGLGAPYGLSYTPGMWLNSIQVSKGVSSVTAGHEAVTGQINLEHRKPNDEEKLFLNLYLNDELRPEINVSTALPVTKNKKLSTIVMFHGSGDTDVREIDHNRDGFRDLPKSDQYNLSNRWLYMADNGMQLRWGVKLLQENRLGGMYSYDTDMRDDMFSNNIYGSQIRNRGANAYIKIGAPVGKAIYDEEKEDELRSNIAFVADYDHFDEDAYFGLNDYLGVENTLSMNLMYNRYLSTRSSLIVGASAHIQNYDETLLNDTFEWTGKRNLFDLSRRENEVGAYAEYTYTLGDKLSFVAGLRGDYNDYFDRSFLTPRSHIRWGITKSTTLRLSAGMGYRTTNVITDNIGILATGRNIVFDSSFDKNFDRQEKAITLGGSLTQIFTLVKPNDATISFDYFRSDFYNQVVVDQEMDADNIHIYNSDGDSYTDTYQVDLTWKPTEGLDIFATYRYSDSMITLNDAQGEQYSVERPLVSRYKTLLNVQYATPYRRWVFDVTAQYNGASRLPSQVGDAMSSSYSPAYPMFFAQVSRKIRNIDLYAGCENIANYHQKDPILNAADPFSTGFNSSVVWGPLMGRKFYVGLRFNLY